MDEGENKYEHKPKFSGNGMSKNSRIKASLFRDKRKGGGGRKGKPKKIEDEGQEVKRLKNLIEKNQVCLHSYAYVKYVTCNSGVAMDLN